MAFVVLILAGGRSQRMGQDKSALQRPDGMTQLDYLIRLAKALNADRILVNHAHPAVTEPVSVIRDRFTDKGPLAGIHAATTELQNGDRLLVLPCDMPALTTSSLQPLLNAPACACFEHYPLPCVLTISTALTSLLEALLNNEESDLSVKHLLSSVNASNLRPESEPSLINTNTPTQWQAFCRQESLKTAPQTPASSQETHHG